MEEPHLGVTDHHRRVRCGYNAAGYPSVGDQAFQFSIPRQVLVQTGCPDLAHGKRSDKVFKAVHVVRMRVGQDHEIDPVDALVPEVGGDNAPADIKTIVIGAAAVDEDVLPRSKRDERAVTLPYIGKLYCSGPARHKKEGC